MLIREDWDLVRFDDGFYYTMERSTCALADRWI